MANSACCFAFKLSNWWHSFNFIVRKAAIWAFNCQLGDLSCNFDLFLYFTRITNHFFEQTLTSPADAFFYRFEIDTQNLFGALNFSYRMVARSMYGTVISDETVIQTGGTPSVPQITSIISFNYIH